MRLDGRLGRKEQASFERENLRSREKYARKLDAEWKRKLRREATAEKRASAGKVREKFARLRATLRRLARRSLVKLRARQAEERRRILAEMRERFARERAELRAHWAERRAALQVITLTKRERARLLARAKREEIRARKLQDKEHRKIHADETRQAAARRAAERRQESDDAVRASIEAEHPEWLSLWDKVKGRIKPSGHLTRREAFFHYVHENPGAVLEAAEEGTDAWIREQLEAEEKRHREAHPEDFAEPPRKAARMARAPKAKGATKARGPASIVWKVLERYSVGNADRLRVAVGTRARPELTVLHVTLDRTGKPILTDYEGDMDPRVKARVLDVVLPALDESKTVTAGKPYAMKRRGLKAKRRNRHEVDYFAGSELVGTLSKRGKEGSRTIWQFSGPWGVGTISDDNQRDLIRAAEKRILEDPEHPAHAYISGAPGPSKPRKAPVNRAKTAAARRAALEAAPF